MRRWWLAHHRWLLHPTAQHSVMNSGFTAILNVLQASLEPTVKFSWSEEVNGNERTTNPAAYLERSLLCVLLSSTRFAWGDTLRRQ